MQNASTLETLELQCDDTASHASIIWMHGLGADGHDFAPIVQELTLPGVRFILPHAPYQPVSLNNGYEMRSWYDIYGLELGSRQNAVGISQMQLKIELLIQQEITRGIAPERILLAGFSQGGAMALHTALRYKHHLAGVLALSTYLPLKDLLKQEASIANHSLAIFMAHGTSDNVITLDVARKSADCLLQLGYAVQWHEYAMAHSVHPTEIDDIRAFVITRLGNPPV